MILTDKEKCLLISEFAKCKTMLDNAKMTGKYNRTVKRFFEDPLQFDPLNFEEVV